MKYSSHKSSGYTLIEMLLYVALIGMLLAAVTVFFGIAADARIKNQTIDEVNSQGEYVLESITQTIRNASSISAPATGSSASQATLVVPTSTLSPTVYSLSSGKVMVQEASAAAVALTDSKVQVSALQFTNLSKSATNQIMKVSITLNRLNPSGRNEYDYQQTFTTSVGLRP